MRKRAMMSALIGVVLLGVTSVASAQTPGGNGKILYNSRAGVNFAVFSMSSDGSESKQLTDDSSGRADGSFSPDGSKIVYADYENSPTANLYLMNSDGSAPTRLTDNPGSETSPSFSPDGGKIVFAGDRAGKSQIYTVNADGTGQTLISDGIGDDLQPTFSPSGNKLAFSSDRSGTNQIYIADADGSNVERLTYDNAADDLSPDFSPDGSKVAFSRLHDVVGDIHVANIDGSGETQITSATVDTNTRPIFAPDGTSLLYTSAGSGVFATVHAIRLSDLSDTPVKTGISFFGGATSWESVHRPVIWDTMVQDGRSIPDQGTATAAIGDGLHIATLDGGQTNSFVGTTSVWFVKGSPTRQLSSCTAATDCIEASDFATAWDGSSVNALIPNGLSVGDVVHVQVNTSHGNSDPSDLAAQVTISAGSPTCPYLDRPCTP